jgi:CelD/BcsL family acetyltransferase involved in cellulose biosynthesis
LESFENLYAYWRDSNLPLRWNCFFVLPPWLKVWWQIFGAENKMHLTAVRQVEEIIGIAPLMLKNGEALFMGDTNVCDYQDFIVAPGKSEAFFNALLDDLNHRGIKQLNLEAVRPDSTVQTDLINVAEARGCQVSCKKLDISYELELPGSWDEYLLLLKGKQRHEIRRKLRRLEEAGDIRYRVVEDPDGINAQIETFFKLFKMSRNDKEIFMNAEMASFFRSLTQTLAAENMLKLFFLDFNDTPAAAVICFDYKSGVYLYNNGFDISFSSLSVGILSKVFSIKTSIQSGKQKYDFLKGAEPYKSHLGGKEVPLYRCEIQLN